MALAYIGIGTNLGDREQNLTDAINLLNAGVGLVLSESDRVESAPWGYKSEEPFLNAVLILQTKLAPVELLLALKQIEMKMGRVMKDVYSDRPIDLDILLYDDVVYESQQLTIPHPLMHQRLFVLMPLNQLKPELQVPGFNQKVSELLENCPDPGPCTWF